MQDGMIPSQGNCYKTNDHVFSNVFSPDRGMGTRREEMGTRDKEMGVSKITIKTDMIKIVLEFKFNDD